MELSKKERLGLIYQLRILEALYPDEAEHFSENREALESGYSLHYEWLFQSLSDDLSPEACREVLDVLDMYRAITFGLQNLADDDSLKTHHRAKFRGFDGNNEGQLMGYVRYFIMDLGRFEELKEGKFPSFNSHMPMLETYRRMLTVWRSFSDKFVLSRDDIAALLGAS